MLKCIEDGELRLSDHDISFVLRAFTNSEGNTSEDLVGTLQAWEGSSVEECTKTGVCVWSYMWSGFLCVEWIPVCGVDSCENPILFSVTQVSNLKNRSLCVEWILSTHKL